METQYGFRPDDILTPGQIAKFCGVDPRTVNKWIDQSLLRAHKLPITHFNRIKVSDYLDFLKSQNMPVPDELKTVAGPRFLIVDDEPSILKVVKLMCFSGYPNAQIETAPSGFEAGRVLERFKPDVVLLDLIMPGINGIEVSKRIKTDPTLKRVCIVILSGYIEEDSRQELNEIGVDLIMEKPVDTQQLMEALSIMLEKNKIKRAA